MAKISEVSEGTKIGRLTVRSLVKDYGPNKDYKYSRWVAITDCECGTQGKKISLSVLGTLVTSCGCLRLERLRAAVGTHMRSKKDKTFIAYGAMKQRTKSNANLSSRYFDRGIHVDEVFLGRDGFAAFLSEVGEHPGDGYSLDRKDNDKGYIPGNIRWATHSEQARNTEKNLWVAKSGKPMLFLEACELEKIRVGKAYERVTKLGWSLAKALGNDEYTELEGKSWKK